MPNETTQYLKSVNNYRRAEGGHTKVRERGEKRLRGATMTGFPDVIIDTKPQIPEAQGAPRQCKYQIPTQRPNIQTENCENQRQL